MIRGRNRDCVTGALYCKSCLFTGVKYILPIFHPSQCSIISVLLHFRPWRTKCSLKKVSKGAKIRNRYNQVPHLTQDTNGKVTNSQPDTTNESQEVTPPPSRRPQSTHKQTRTKTQQTQGRTKTQKIWPARKTPNLPTHHPPQHTNQDITRR